MSTSGKTSIRKDKFSGISNIFAEQDAANAALKEQTVAKAETEQAQQPKESTGTEPNEVVNKPKTNKAKTEKGRGVTKSNAAPKEPTSDSFFSRPKKVTNMTKSVYLSTTNIAFLEERSKEYSIPFSAILNQIIDNFRQNF